MTKPCVGLIGDTRELDELPFQVVGDKYVQSIARFADCRPLAVLAITDGAPPEDLVARLDGFVFTGSASNIRPERYAGAESEGPFDESRDALSIELIRAVVAASVPALFICRGLQELNVALGGTLHPDVASAPGRRSHYPAPGLSYAERYAVAHDVRLDTGSPLVEVFGHERFAVNSLHHQALDRIAVGLTVHGRADDGTPEVVAVDDHPFAVGVQWHPEYRPEEREPDRRLLEAFGAAARERFETARDGDVRRSARLVGLS